MNEKTSNNTNNNEKIKTGIIGFDEITYGGIALGKTTLLSGTSGSGKTILAAQFIANGIDLFNENGVFITFEENLKSLKKNLSHFGWDFDKWEQEKKVIFIDASIALQHNTKVVGNYDLSGLFHRIEQAIIEIKPKRIVLDSIGSLFFQFEDPTVVRNELFKVASFLDAKGLSTIMTAERLDDYGHVSRFGVEEYIADHVIILRNKLEKHKRSRTIEIFKYRGSDHKSGEQPFIITGEKGIVILPSSTLEMTQKSSGKRVTSGNERLDEMCGGGFFRDSIILVSGATGTGKTLMVSEFLKGGFKNKEKILLLAFEESEEQLTRNSLAWGVDLVKMQNEGLLKISTEYPEICGMEEHLYRIMTLIDEFKPSRIALDSLSALERGTTTDSFRSFIISLTSFLKKREITALLTSTSSKIFGENSVTQAHISTITDSIILLRYTEVVGKIFRVITVLKMRGSIHDKDIYEYSIDGNGMNIQKSFLNVSGILGGATKNI